MVTQKQHQVVILPALAQDLERGEVAGEGHRFPGQRCCEASAKATQSRLLPDLRGHLGQGPARLDLLLDLHHLDGTDDEGPDGAGHDAVPGDVGDCVVPHVPAHNAVHPEGDGIGERYGAEGGGETAVEPEKLRRNQRDIFLF